MSQIVGYGHKGNSKFPKKKGKMTTKKKADMAWNFIKNNKPEVKYRDIDSRPSVGTTGIAQNISQVAEGTGENERIGRDIKAVYLSIRGQVVLHPSASNTTMRVCIVRDYSNNPGTVALVDVLNTAGASSALQYPFAPPNSDNKKRFKILASQIVAPNDSASLAIPIKFFIKLRGDIAFDGPLATDYASGQLYIVAVSNDAVNTPTLGYSSRLAYRDN